MLKIDTHHHFWNLTEVEYPWLKPEHGIIYGLFDPAKLEPQVKAAGIDKTVIVQSADSYEDTASMLVTSDHYDWIGGVVGWANLLKPDEVNQRMEMYKKHPKFRGIRHLIHGEENPDWIIQDKVIESLKVLAHHGMTYDVVAVFPNHLKHVPTLAERVPNLKMVIDHLAKPPVGHSTSLWFEQMGAAAQSTNVYAKMSGLFDNASWTVADLKPYTDFVIERFGANRVMFGSDWPVSINNGVSTYATVWENSKNLIAGLSKDAQDMILGGTAMEFYRLS
jgi:L-fuconolactonase